MCGYRDHSLTQEQKRELIRDQVKETPERSNRQVARDLGVSPTTVGTVRDELEATVQIGQSDERVGADGRVINVANIGQRPAAAPAPPRTLEEWPVPLPDHEPIEDIDGEQYATLPLDAATASTRPPRRSPGPPKARPRQTRASDGRNRADHP